MKMKISWYSVSEKGSFAVNEDCVRIEPVPGGVCVALADGLGGNGFGDTASKIAAEESVKALKESGSPDTAFLSAQKAVRSEQSRRGVSGSMLTTLCVLRILEKEAESGHVGDSRIYYFRDGKRIRRTHDHSVPQMLSDAGEIKETEIRFHPDRNRVLHVIGTDWEEAEYELEKTVSLSSGGIFRKHSAHAFLLCTDGWWELISEEQMERSLMESKTPEEWIENMKSLVEEAGQGMEMDNYTAAAVFVE